MAELLSPRRRPLSFARSAHLFLVEEQIAPEGVGNQPQPLLSALELGGRDLPAVEEAQRQPVDDGLAEGLYHVERERLAAVADAVEEADGGVESSGFESPFFVPWDGTG